MGRDWDKEEDDDTLPVHGRSQKAEFFVCDTEPFWAAIEVWVGSPYLSESFEFPLTCDPIPDLKHYTKTYVKANQRTCLFAGSLEVSTCE